MSHHPSLPSFLALVALFSGPNPLMEAPAPSLAELSWLTPLELASAAQLATAAATAPPTAYGPWGTELAYSTIPPLAPPLALGVPGVPMSLVYGSPWMLLALAATLSLVLLTPPHPPLKPSPEAHDLIYTLRDMVLKLKQFCDLWLRKFHNILQDLIERHGDNATAMAEAMGYFYQLFTVEDIDDGVALLGVLQQALMAFKINCVAPNQRLDDTSDDSDGARRALALRRPCTYMECQHCGSRDTPEWRRGPDGPRLVCNACGLFYLKLIRKYGRLEATLMMRTRKLNGQDHDRRVS